MKSVLVIAAACACALACATGKSVCPVTCAYAYQVTGTGSTHRYRLSFEHRYRYNLIMYVTCTCIYHLSPVTYRLFWLCTGHRQIPVDRSTGQQRVAGFKTDSSKNMQVHSLPIPVAILYKTGWNLSNFISVILFL